MVDDGIEGAAIGPERIVVFHDGTFADPFELLGVFDTETLEPVEFSGLPDLGVEGALYEGRVAALDDGFLAYVSWIVDGQTSVRRTLYSADGSMWVEHPTATSDDVDVWDTSWWPGPATYEGVNLVAGPGGGLLATDDGLEFDAVSSPARYSSPVTATEAGFFVVTGLGPELFHSTDGSEWRRLETPPTWALGESGEEGFVSGTVLTIDDDLYAFTIRGVPLGFGAIEDPVTEIWRADASFVPEVPPGVTSTLEAFTEATNTYDSEALGALFTEDFTWQSTGEVQSRTEYLAHFDTYYENLELHAELTGPLTIERDGDAYVAKQTDRITSNGNPDMTGREVIRLVEVEGSWLIQKFRWTQDAAN
jgi:hypothetical protein